MCLWTVAWDMNLNINLCLHLELESGASMIMPNRDAIASNLPQAQETIDLGGYVNNRQPKCLE